MSSIVETQILNELVEIKTLLSLIYELLEEIKKKVEK